jgi:hypothetical protein
MHTSNVLGKAALFVCYSKISTCSLISKGIFQLDPEVYSYCEAKDYEVTLDGGQENPWEAARQCRRI